MTSTAQERETFSKHVTQAISDHTRGVITDTFVKQVHAIALAAHQAARATAPVQVSEEELRGLVLNAMKGAKITPYYKACIEPDCDADEPNILCWCCNGTGKCIAGFEEGETADAIQAEAIARAILNRLNLPQSDGWRDISTAPKDGTHILMWGGYHSPFSGYYRDKWVERVGWHISGGIHIDPTAEPTHWMPLPQPPQEH